MGWPRREGADWIGAKPALAHSRTRSGWPWRSSLAGWSDDYGFATDDAVMLLGQVAEARCAKLVNPKYTYVAKIAKRHLG